MNNSTMTLNVKEETPLKPSGPGARQEVTVFTKVPWYVWCYACSAVTMVLSLMWDISWHRSIGRDTKWIVPHLGVYGSAIWGEICCAYMILGTSFGKTILKKNESTRIWGFYGPLGAFIGVWSGATLVVLSFLDDWWHLTFGLDVMIGAPVHLFILYVFLIYDFAGLVLIAKFLNQSIESAAKGFYFWFAIVCGTLLMHISVLQWEYIRRSIMHQSLFYLSVSIAAPALLVGISGVLSFRWSSTAIAGAYSLLQLGLLWILPLFPAEPKLGPVLQEVTHFIPPDFPLLYIVPAFFLDLLKPYLSQRGRWVHAISGAAVFIITFGIAQWYFAYVLMSPVGRTRFFGEYHYPFRFFMTNEAWAAHLVLRPRIRYSEAAFIPVVAICSSWVGLLLKDWMKKIRR